MLFFILSKSLDLAVSPLVWVLVLVGAALWMVARRSQNRRRIVGCLVMALAVILVLGNPSIADRIFQSIEDDAPNTYDEAKTYDAVILLGGLVPGGATDPARPSYDNGVERLLVTYDLLRTDRAKHVIIASGSQLGDATFVKESTALRIQLEKWGIAKERIFVDEASLNTRQNAIETARIVKERGFTKLVLVTSAFHMTRAAGCFRAVDLDFDTLPADYRVLPARLRPTEIAPRTGAFHQSGEVFRELLGRGVYRALGYTK